MTSITDLAEFDMEFVLSYLELRDLINLADINIYLRNIIRSYLIIIFNKMVVLTGNPTTDIVYIPSDPFRFFGFILILKFLRIFGDQLKFLCFCYINEKEKAFRVGQYVNIYCCNLNILIFQSLPLTLSYVFQNVFNVKFLFFEYCHVDFHALRVSMIFPKLKKLSLFRVKIENSKEFIKSYTCLQLLIIDNFSLKYINIKLLQQINPCLRIVIVQKWEEYSIFKQNILNE